MVSNTYAPPTSQVGPRSRAIDRGIIGAGLDGRSKQARALRRIESELLAQIDHEPTFVQRFLVRRVARAMVRAELQDDACNDQAISTDITSGLRQLGLIPASVN